MIPAPDSVGALCKAIEPDLPRLVLHDVENAAQLEPLQRKQWEEQLAEFIVIDLKTLSLHHAISRLPFAQGDVRFALRTLQDARAYTVGVGDLRSLGPIPDTALQEPRSWCSALLASTRQQLQAMGYDVLGDLGATIFQRGETRENWSAYDGYDDLLTRYGFAKLPSQI